ncbi:hypothetical protein ACWGQ2_10700 [Arthrobacter sp. NPDC055585]
MTAGFVIQVAAFALSCIFALLRLPDAIRGRNRSIFACLVLVAVAMGLSLPVFYNFVDPLLGGSNHANLVLRLTLYGVFVILGVRGAAAFGARRARSAVIGPAGLAVLGVTVVLTVWLFFASDLPVTSAGLAAYSGQASLDAYAHLGRMYPAYVAACICVPALAASLNRRYRTSHRVGAGLFGAGLAVVVIFSALTLLGPLGAFMLILPFSAVILVATGLTVMWVSRRLSQRRPKASLLAERYKNVS